MLSLNPWRHTTIGLASLAIAATGLITPTLAETPASPQAVAQGGLIGQCRQTNKRTPFYTTRTGTTPTPADYLAADARVTLSDNGQGGLIGVSQVNGSARNGFVLTKDLKQCSGTPPTATNTCRRVVFADGLIIRSGPTTSSAIAGNVAYNAKLYVTQNPPTTQKDATGRSWVQIAQPTAGWVSNGYSGSNLVYCQ